MDREAIFWHFPAYLESYKGLRDESRDTLFRTRPVSVIRKGDWKLLLFHEEWILDGGIGEVDNNRSVELYNLANDPWEQSNLAGNPAYEPVKMDLIGMLRKWMEETGDPLLNGPIAQGAFIQRMKAFRSMENPCPGAALEDLDR